MLKIIVEYINGSIKEFIMSRNVWIDYMLQVLEYDNSVTRYNVIELDAKISSTKV